MSYQDSSNRTVKSRLLVIENFCMAKLPDSHHRDHLGESIPHSRGKDLHKPNNPEPYQNLDNFIKELKNYSC